MERKRNKKIDQNFAKMNLKAQRAVVESYNNSIQYEEEEEEFVSSKRTSKRIKGRKGKHVREESDDDDIEVLEITESSSVSSVVIKKSSKDNSDSEIEVLDIDDDEEVVETRRGVTITKVTKKNVDEKLLAEESDLVKPKADLVEVKSNSGKRMMVSRDTLERLMKEKAQEAPEEILLSEDNDDETRDPIETRSKRKQNSKSLSPMKKLRSMG